MLNVGQLWVDRHPEMKEAEAALAEAIGQWIEDAAAYDAKVRKAEAAVVAVRSNLLALFETAHSEAKRVPVPRHISVIPKTPSSPRRR